MSERSKFSLILPVAVVAVLAAAGLLAYKRQPSPDPEPVSLILARVAANETLVRKTRDGVAVLGEVSDADLEQIRSLVSPLTDEPFYLFEVMGEDEIKVSTGVMRGIEDGGGDYFVLRRINGKWAVLTVGSWVS